MILKGTSPINNKKSPLSVLSVINKIYHEHYEELYEPKGTYLLQDALNEVLNLFQSHEVEVLCRLRYVWMALILASVVQPTLNYYQPNNLLLEATINQVRDWLLNTLSILFNPQKRINGIEKVIHKEEQSLSGNSDLANYQILIEALNVFKNTIKMTNESQPLELLLDILDDCLEGYAIFPGSEGRRELFDWWLLKVVPASWFLVSPDSLYSTNKNINLAKQKDKLEEISDQMWNIMRPLQNSKTNHSEFNINQSPVKQFMNIQTKLNSLNTDKTDLLTFKNSSLR